jgi:hypothetical protein
MAFHQEYIKVLLLTSQGKLLGFGVAYFFLPILPLDNLPNNF